ncbi:MAG: 3-oxoacyl-ACP reductase FabG [Rickettsiaceae bacterium]|nr:3-oxoacyl-ACP reductase FabG [Rickettsiaceae bacterium]
MHYQLEGKVALVTGASGGIGAECARVLHYHGANLVLSGTNLEKLESLKKELGSRVEVKSCDLGNESETEELISSLDKIHILVSNAGKTKDNLAIRMKNEDFDDVMNINLRSSFILNRGAIKKMMSERFGRIINISSVVGVSGNPGQANYCASKAGLIGMTKSLALETASRNITINSIAPGFIKTSMTNKLSEEQIKSIESRIPSKKLGEPIDIAQTVAFLASEGARYITGQTIHVNGGMYLV